MADILIVDSYRILGTFYQEILREEGHQVFVATNSKEAIDLASEHHIDVVVVEERLPDLQAEKLLHKLKQLQPHIQGTICTVTDFGRKAESDLCDESVMKTSDFSILQKKVKELLQRSSSPD